MLGTRQRSNAVMKDAPTTPSIEEQFAFGMDQISNAAIMKDAPTKPRKEDFVSGIGKSKNGRSTVLQTM